MQTETSLCSKFLLNYQAVLESGPKISFCYPNKFGAYLCMSGDWGEKGERMVGVVVLQPVPTSALRIAKLAGELLAKKGGVSRSSTRPSVCLSSQ